MITAFAKFMSEFWWRYACPQPDGWWNCHLVPRHGSALDEWMRRWTPWARGGPYHWTKLLHVPWYLLTHSRERFRYQGRFPWWRMPLSVLLMPFGAAIFVANHRWRWWKRIRQCQPETREEGT